MRWLALALLLGGCRDAAPARSAAAGGATGFLPVADVQQLMLALVEPAAETYWDAVGWVVDSAGTQEIRPTTVEEWEAVRNAAVVVAESGNLLMMEGRAVDDRTWPALSRAMVEVGTRAIAAAEARDEAAVFTVGGDLYEACTACHAAYALETLRPSHQRD